MCKPIQSQLKLLPWHMQNFSYLQNHRHLRFPKVQKKWGCSSTKLHNTKWCGARGSSWCACVCAKTPFRVSSALTILCDTKLLQRDVLIYRWNSTTTTGKLPSQLQLKWPPDEFIRWRFWTHRVWHVQVYANRVNQNFAEGTARCTQTTTDLDLLCVSAHASFMICICNKTGF